MEFKVQLFNLLKSNNLTISDLSRATGISTARLSNYYNGKDMPALDNAILLINFFKCRMDYLLGLSKEYIVIAEKRKYSQNDFLYKLKLLNDINLISQRNLCKQIELNKSCFSNWHNGQKPKTTTLIKLAVFFDCSTDYLLGFERRL